MQQSRCSSLCLCVGEDSSLWPATINSTTTASGTLTSRVYLLVVSTTYPFMFVTEPPNGETCCLKNVKVIFMSTGQQLAHQVLVVLLASALYYSKFVLQFEQIKYDMIWYDFTFHLVPTVSVACHRPSLLFSVINAISVSTDHHIAVFLLKYI